MDGMRKQKGRQKQAQENVDTPEAKKRTEKWLIWIKEKEWKTAANDNKGERGELN